MDTSKAKAQIWAKGTTERACLLLIKKIDVCNFKKMSRERIYPHYGFNEKNQSRIELQS